MDALIAFLAGHQVAITAGAFWLVAALAHGMPAPEPIGSLWYRWLYGTLQYLSANLPSFNKNAKNR